MESNCNSAVEVFTKDIPSRLELISKLKNHRNEDIQNSLELYILERPHFTRWVDGRSTDLPLEEGDNRFSQNKRPRYDRNLMVLNVTVSKVTT